jgi:hypothetical protein
MGAGRSLGWIDGPELGQLARSRESAANTPRMGGVCAWDGSQRNVISCRWEGMCYGFGCPVSAEHRVRSWLFGAQWAPPEG